MIEIKDKIILLFCFNTNFLKKKKSLMNVILINAKRGTIIII